jgi:Ca2+/Na+ antiporter
VIELGGAVALWIAAVTLALVLGGCSPALGLVLVAALLIPYVVVLGLPHERLGRLPLPASWRRWLVAAITEEEVELEVAFHPRRGGRRDVLWALAAVVTVVGASIAMERAASTLGARHAVPGIVIGGLVLAAVTSLPNAVAAIYLARRGRAAATLSTALNSNAINVLAGLLIPTTLLGFASGSSETTFFAAAYVAMTVLVLVSCHRNRGLSRGAGAIIVAAYALFVAVVLATSL